jgi:hypothetical protein
MSSLPARRRFVALGLIAVTGLLAAGCGSGSNDTPTNLSLSISEQGKSAAFKNPSSAEGGLVTVKLTNKGRAPHGVQFIQYTGNHTMADVLKQLGSNSSKIPSWVKLPGGIGSIPGGQTGRATLNLPQGNYVLVDAAALGGPSSGRPATAGIKLTGGSSGDLPSTAAQVSADRTGKDKYKWDISGLEAGSNQITFDSKGEDAVHLIAAAPVKGKAPPLGQIKKDLASNGPPPPYIDVSAIQTTALLDGGDSQTLSLDLKKPGQYVFFCPLTDRDGKGKPHDQEGLLTVETVK